MLQPSYYINKNISIGASFTLPSSYECADFECVTNLKLIFRNENQLSMSLWCDSPAIMVAQKDENRDQLSCELNEVDAANDSYPLSAIVQVHTVGTFVAIFSAIFPNNPNENGESIEKEIVVENSPLDADDQTLSRRDKRQSIDGNTSQAQMIPADNGTTGKFKMNYYIAEKFHVIVSYR